LSKAVGHDQKLLSEELLPLVYDELRRLAASRMAEQAADQTLQRVMARFRAERQAHAICAMAQQRLGHSALAHSAGTAIWSLTEMGFAPPTFPQTQPFRFWAFGVYQHGEFGL
jgi:hypothetical protein